jgi:hypothetical protein
MKTILTDTLRDSGKWSEKRITRLTIVIFLMSMTVVNFCTHGFEIEIEVFLSWLGFAGYDGYRIYQEKKLEKSQPPKEEGS